MRQSADSSRTADESPRPARRLRHLVAGQWRTGDGAELVDVSPARPGERVDVGVLHIDSETAGADPHVPFGGAKHSAYGPKGQGRAAREFFTRTKTVYVRSSGGR